MLELMYYIIVFAYRGITGKDGTCHERVGKWVWVCVCSYITSFLGRDRGYNDHV